MHTRHHNKPGEIKLPDGRKLDAESVSTLYSFRCG